MRILEKKEEEERRDEGQMQKNASVSRWLKQLVKFFQSLLQPFLSLVYTSTSIIIYDLCTARLALVYDVVLSINTALGTRQMYF